MSVGAVYILLTSPQVGEYTARDRSRLETTDKQLKEVQAPTSVSLAVWSTWRDRGVSGSHVGRLRRAIPSVIKPALNSIDKHESTRKLRLCPSHTSAAVAAFSL